MKPYIYFRAIKQFWRILIECSVLIQVSHISFFSGWELQDFFDQVFVQLEVNHIVGYHHGSFSKEKNQTALFRKPFTVTWYKETLEYGRDGRMLKMKFDPGMVTICENLTYFMEHVTNLAAVVYWWHNVFIWTRRQEKMRRIVCKAESLSDSLPRSHYFLI